jgi:SAM-dependent methyltransferase
VTRLDDQAAVRREYADESGLSARIAAQQNSNGPDPRDVALAAVVECAPSSVLEVGPGRGELAERIKDATGARVVGVDQSERMVELTSGRGIEAIVGNVEDLPFEDASFDCAVAAWMLYHVENLELGLGELDRVLRPGGRLVAVTNSVRSQHELFDRIGYVPDYGFGAENAEDALRPHFATVERRDVHGTVTYPDWEAANRYLEASPVVTAQSARPLERFDGALVCSRHVTVFVAEKPT